MIVCQRVDSVVRFVLVHACLQTYTTEIAGEMIRVYYYWERDLTYTKVLVVAVKVAVKMIIFHYRCEYSASSFHNQDVQ